MENFVPSFAQENSTVVADVNPINVSINDKVETTEDKEQKKRFTTEDFAFVKENCATMTVTQMAEARELTPVQIKRIIAKAIELLNKAFEDGKLTEIQRDRGLIKFTPIKEEKKRERKKTDKPTISSMMDDFVASLID